MQPNPRKTKSLLDLGPVDIAELRAAVLAIPEPLWDQENQDKPNKFDALDRTKHIVFRFVNNLFDWRESFNRPLWATWQRLLEPVMLQAVAPYGYRHGEFPRVMFARMAPGGIVKPHRDGSPSARWPHKIHVPILTNDQVEFFIDPATHHLDQGRAYEVNNMGLHAVANKGNTDRIHLIFEYYDKDQPVQD